MRVKNRKKILKFVVKLLVVLLSSPFPLLSHALLGYPIAVFCFLSFLVGYVLFGILLNAGVQIMFVWFNSTSGTDALMHSSYFVVFGLAIILMQLLRIIGGILLSIDQMKSTEKLHPGRIIGMVLLQFILPGSGILVILTKKNLVLFCANMIFTFMEFLLVPVSFSLGLLFWQIYWIVGLKLNEYSFGYANIILGALPGLLLSIPIVVTSTLDAVFRVIADLLDIGSEEQRLNEGIFEDELDKLFYIPTAISAYALKYAHHFDTIGESAFSENDPTKLDRTTFGGLITFVFGAILLLILAFTLFNIVTTAPLVSEYGNFYGGEHEVAMTMDLVFVNLTAENFSSILIRTDEYTLVCNEVAGVCDGSFYNTTPLSNDTYYIEEDIRGLSITLKSSFVLEGGYISSGIYVVFGTITPFKVNMEVESIVSVGNQDFNVMYPQLYRPDCAILNSDCPNYDSKQRFEFGEGSVIQNQAKLRFSVNSPEYVEGYTVLSKFRTWYVECNSFCDSGYDPMNNYSVFSSTASSSSKYEHFMYGSRNFGAIFSTIGSSVAIFGIREPLITLYWILVRFKDKLVRKFFVVKIKLYEASRKPGEATIQEMTVENVMEDESTENYIRLEDRSEIGI